MGGRLLHRMLLRRRPPAPVTASARAAAMRAAATGVAGAAAVGEVSWVGRAYPVHGEGSAPALAAATAAVDWCRRASGLAPGGMKLGALFCAHLVGEEVWQMVCSVTTADGASSSVVDLTWRVKRSAKSPRQEGESPEGTSGVEGWLESQVTLCPGPGADVAAFDPRGLAVHLDEQ